MTEYTPQQVAQIREAVAAGREAMRLARRHDPLIFARAFVAAGGVQLPGEPQAPAALAARLLAALERNEAGTDPVLMRELERVRTEVRWAAAADDDEVVGFRLELPPAAVLEPACREIMKADRGLGAAVFRKAEIVVLPLACGTPRFTPVYAHDVEQ